MVVYALDRRGTAYLKNLLKCPFCGEEDFDPTGLKVHLTWCDEFEKVPDPDMSHNDAQPEGEI